MIKNLKGLFTLAIVMIGSVAVNAQTATTATATATVGAKVITPITLTKTSDMNFGNLVATTTGGTIVLGLDGVRQTSTVQLPAVPGTVSAAAFTVGGEALYAYTITLPTTYTISSVTGGSTSTMTLADFVASPDATALSATGTGAFSVGATLTVAANQASGTYIGVTPLNVSVNYN